MLSVGKIQDAAGGADDDVRLLVGDGLDVLLDVDTCKNEGKERRTKVRRIYNTTITLIAL